MEYVCSTYLFGSLADFARPEQPFASRIKSSLSRRQSVDPSPEITVIPGFPNLEIYDLVANLLGIEEEGRAKNNGTEGFWEQYLL